MQLPSGQVSGLISHVPVPAVTMGIVDFEPGMLGFITNWDDGGRILEVDEGGFLEDSEGAGPCSFGVVLLSDFLIWTCLGTGSQVGSSFKTVTLEGVFRRELEEVLGDIKTLVGLGGVCEARFTTLFDRDLPGVSTGEQNAVVANFFGVM